MPMFLYEQYVPIRDKSSYKGRDILGLHLGPLSSLSFELPALLTLSCWGVLFRWRCRIHDGGGACKDIFTLKL